MTPALAPSSSPRISAVIVAAAVSTVLWPSPASAHHPQAAVESSIWDSVADGLFVAAIVCLCLSALAALVWVAGPANWQRQSLLRSALIGLALSAVLGACASGSESMGSGDDADPSALFNADGTDALAVAVTDEANRPGTGEGLPDLVGFIGGNYSTEEVEFAGQRMLVYNFDGIVGNIGTGPLDIFGDPQLADPSDPNSHEVYQREWTGSEWENLDKVPIRFESADGHNHFHQMELARYTLHDPATKTKIAPSQKVGFCFLDSQPLGYWQAGKDLSGAAELNAASPSPYAAADRVDSYCRAGSPHAESLLMGISPGWGDLYAEELALQWVDISNVVPGRYVLSSEMDPNDVIAESDDTNNGPVFHEDTLTIGGYRATPVFATTQAGAPVQVVLTAESFGQGLVDPSFTVETEPTNGTLDVAEGEAGVGPTVTYTPNAGFSGVDTFEFSVRETGWDYPIVPTRAEVMIAVDADTPALAISGYRPELSVEAGMELAAVTPTGPVEASQVAWAVNGVPGGDEAVGKVVDGFYSPGTETGEITVTANATGSEASITFMVTEVPNHAPFIGEPVTYQGDGDIVSSDPQSPARELTTFTAGEPLAVLVPVIDIDGDPLNVTATGLPEGLTMGLSTGAITGTTDEAGTYDIEVTASDGVDETTETITLEIQ